MFYCTYVLYSYKDGKFYIGYTNSLKKRIEEHAKGLSLATKQRRPLNLVYFEASLNKEDAVRREKYFKTGFGRRFLNTRLKSWKSTLSKT